MRLDTLLADRGLFASRTRAAASVMAGEVRVGHERRRAAKPGELVSSDVAVELAQRPRFVSRGGEKLANGLLATAPRRLDVVGRKALDVGASTGGFTDCLLQLGVEHVTCVDVGYGILDARLRQDARVTVIDRCNARYLVADELPYRPDLIVVDVAFISLTRVLPAVLASAAPRYDALALVKPQFEVGRERVGRGGVVRDAGARREALVTIAETAQRLGAAVLGFASSGLPGPKGNRETFIWLAEPTRPDAVADLAKAARGVEP
ncbi:MAG: TlyA family RNA methyltransferase [Solirubrobacteraceae bacterium]|nr:MAG: TlyA family rRNA (cytidine-2'-O)-methyltransferase [Solirubrobacterales bacterium]